jgi:hypothetical protein
MSGHVRTAAVCALVAVVLLGPCAGAAVADSPRGSASPTPTPDGTPPVQLVPVAPPPAVTGLRFAAGDAGDEVTVLWTGSSAARNYTVQVQGPDSTERRTFETAESSLGLTRVPPGATIRVGIVAHGPGGDSTSADATWTRPAAVPPVASAVLTPTRTGLRVTWVPSSDAPRGSRYVVRIRGADGTVLARTVRGSAVGFAGVRRDTLYSASLVTEAPDGRHSSPFDVSAVLVPALGAAPPGGGPAAPPAPGSAPQAATRGGTAPVVPAVDPLATPSPVAASATLISSPAMALACAVAALLLGGSAIAVLLRRRPRTR